MDCDETSLRSLRRRLDQIDRQILSLVAQRQTVIADVARFKRASGLAMRDVTREREMFDSARALALELQLSPTLAEELLRLLIRASLTIQEKSNMRAGAVGTGQSVLIIGGAGQMGGWFATFLAAQGFSVEIADPRGAEKGRSCVSDWRDTDLRYDFIVLATPMAETNTIFSELVNYPPTAILFDLCAVKTPLFTSIRALVTRGWQVTSLNPLFGPETELLSGHQVLFVDCQCPQALRLARELFAATSVKQRVVSPENHDRLVAHICGSLFLKIATAEALIEAETTTPGIGHTSGAAFDGLNDAAERGLLDPSHTRPHIQSLNGQSSEPFAALEAAIERIRKAIAAGDGGS